MAKKGGSKESVFRDSNLSSSVEQKMTSESSKQKIAKIHDIFPNATKDQISKILQYYEDDENKAVDALTRDGGTEALSNWAESGSLKSKNNKKNKKRKKGRKEADLPGSATASFDADDSSSLHSSGNVDAEVEKECSVGENRNGVHDLVDETKEAPDERLNTPETDVQSYVSKNFPVPKSDSETVPDVSSIPEGDPKCSSAEAVNPTCISPVSDSSDKQDEPSYKKDRYKNVRDEGHGKHSSRQRTNSFQRSKTTSVSEDSTIANNPPNLAMPTKRGYEKCKKDLSRQTISLQRIQNNLDKGLEESSKKIKNAFSDVRKLLDKRQEQIEQELTKTKEDALNLLKSRQELAVELKRRVDRTASLTENEWTELRSDVKQFVTERKHDDELGKKIWFQWSMDQITEIVNSFGEVQPVKNVYSQRSHSALDNVAASQNPEPSPSSSLANEEIGSSADKNDVANICDAVEEEAVPTVKKDVAPPVNRSQQQQQPNESHTARVFSNTKFYNNNFGGGNRRFRGGNRSFSYPRPNNRNMGYRNNYNPHYDYDYKSHSQQDRVSHEFQNDRNMNSSHRSNRRAQNTNYRNTGRFRGGGNVERQYYQHHHQHHPSNNNNNNSSNVAKVVAPTASNEKTPVVDSEKSNVVNGYGND